MRFRLSAVAILGAALLAGCGARSSLRVPEDRTSDPSGTGGQGGIGTGGTGGQGGIGGTGGTGGEPIDAGMDAEAGFPPVVEEIFVNSGSTLFRFDVNSTGLITVGPFNGCSSAVLDIALDREGHMFGTTFNGLFQIDPLTAACTLIAPGSYPNSLCTVPAGTVDPVDEALVGFLTSQYVRIDKKTGALTVLGKLGINGYESSGDMAVLPGGQAFSTIKGNECNDCLVEIDPLNGHVLQKISPLPFSQVFGLASSLGQGFGFTSSGEIFKVDLVTGDTMELPVLNNVGYFGAASRATP